MWICDDSKTRQLYHRENYSYREKFDSITIIQNYRVKQPRVWLSWQYSYTIAPNSHCVTVALDYNIMTITYNVCHAVSVAILTI